MTKNRRNPRRRGITTVEFALTLPFIIILVMGMVEVGTMYFSWMTVQKAAQTGARFAATGIGEEEGTRMTQILQQTEDWMEALDKGGKVITVSSWPTTSATGEGVSGNAGGPCQLVEVAVVYSYHPFTPIVGSMFPDVIEISGQDRKINEPWKPCGG